MKATTQHHSAADGTKLDHLEKAAKSAQARTTDQRLYTHLRFEKVAVACVGYLEHIFHMVLKVACSHK